MRSRRAESQLLGAALLAVLGISAAVAVGSGLIELPWVNRSLIPSPSAAESEPSGPSPTLHASAALAGEMTEARTGHTSTLLPDGRVLVAGGYSGKDNYSPGASAYAFGSAELYDPGSGTWTTTGNLLQARFGHTATLLPDGTVLVAGGYSGNPEVSALASAELYNPSSDTWTATGTMNAIRGGHTATPLRDGKVLVTGGASAGSDSFALLASAELYDPSRGIWTATGNMADVRTSHTATLLRDGNVLVAGGIVFGAGDLRFLGSAELYHPSSGSWTPTGDMNQPRSYHTTTMLADGRVLVAAGNNTSGPVVPAELYDPSQGVWTATGSMAGGRFGYTATLMADGKVLVAGGSDGSSLLGAELYDPSSGAWTATGSMVTPRLNHTATVLPDGKVLVAGGIVWRFVTIDGRTGVDGNTVRALASAEVYDPRSGTWTVTGD